MESRKDGTPPHFVEANGISGMLMPMTHGHQCSHCSGLHALCPDKVVISRHAAQVRIHARHAPLIELS